MICFFSQYNSKKHPVQNQSRILGIYKSLALKSPNAIRKNNSAAGRIEKSICGGIQRGLFFWIGTGIKGVLCENER